MLLVLQTATVSSFAYLLYFGDDVTRTDFGRSVALCDACAVRIKIGTTTVVVTEQIRLAKAVAAFNAVDKE